MECKCKVKCELITMNSGKKIPLCEMPLSFRYAG